jgi:hypothetical protein
MLLLPAVNAAADVEAAAGVEVYLVKLDGSEKMLDEFYARYEKKKLPDGKPLSAICKVVSVDAPKHLGYIDFQCQPIPEALPAMAEVYYDTTNDVTLRESLFKFIEAIPNCSGKICLQNDGGTSCKALYCSLLRKYLCYHEGQKACSNHVCQ